jgi:hypothetical protein
MNLYGFGMTFNLHRVSNARDGVSNARDALRNDRNAALSALSD